MELIWILARNARRRPTLSHAMDPNDREFTLCGVWLIGWSTFAMKKPIVAIACKRCAKIAGVEL
jgi:hypothetical protein